MTDPAPGRRRRLSRRALRVWAWATGAAGFALPAAVLGLSPKAASAGPGPAVPERPRVVIERRLVKRVVVIQEAPAASAGVTFVPAGPAPVVAAPAPPPPPPAPVAPSGGS